ncbi:MAG TPA: protein kinase [Trebonia sp.]|nr:protein kinase [Trebonia sp.]
MELDHGMSDPGKDGTAGRLVGGRYRLAGAIGRGSMGRVWRARDELLDRDVALKEVLFPRELDEADRQELRQRQLREARSAARLSHPAVATVFDVIQEHGNAWIVMEFVRGRSLDRILEERGPLPPHVVARIGQDVLAALAAAHAVGVLHRDVKPSNVLLTKGGGAVLTDFGVATIDGDPMLTRSGMVMGTPAYSAPERIRGDPATAAGDLWSLGLTLYAASEGQGPYDKCGSIASTVAAIATEDPAPPGNAGPNRFAIMALLSRDPAARPTAEAAIGMLADALTALQAGTTVVPVGAAQDVLDPVLPSQPAPSSRKRRRRRLVLIGAAALVVLGGSLWAVHRSTGWPSTLQASSSALGVVVTPAGGELPGTGGRHKPAGRQTGKTPSGTRPAGTRPGVPGATSSRPPAGQVPATARPASPAQSPGGGAQPSDPPVVPQDNLAPFYNRVGVTSDNGPSSADYDSGNSGYSRQQLAADGITAGGTFSSRGLTYRWPSAPPNAPDSIRVAGQTVPVPALPGATVIGLVGSAADVGSTPSTGTVTVNYTDGSKSTATLTMTDWAYGSSPASRDTVVAEMSYRDEGSNATPTKISMALFSTTIAVNRAKTVASVTLPSAMSAGVMGIFCLTVGT